MIAHLKTGNSFVLLLTVLAFLTFSLIKSFIQAMAKTKNRRYRNFERSATMHLNSKCLTAIIVFDIQMRSSIQQNTPNSNSQHTNISHKLNKHKINAVFSPNIKQKPCLVAKLETALKCQKQLILLLGISG